MSTWGLKSQLIKAFFTCISMGALFGGVRSSNNAIVEGIVDSQAQFRIERGLNDASKAIYSQN